MASAVSSFLAPPSKMHPESDDASSVGSSEAFNYEAYSAYSASSATAASAPAKKGAKPSLTISTNAPMGKPAPKKAPASDSSSDKEDADAKDGAPRPDHLKPRLCTVPGCKKRVRSKGLCKAHGGGRRCMVEGCERSSQGQGLCIRHGGGKRCTQPGCTKASQSNGLCKAHGGGLRCMAGNCTKSSQGGGFCRAHGGGQRCEKEGCNKGAQRGGFCAGHGGSRFCQHPDCTKNDRGGGYCAEHGGGKRCDQQGCNKPARKKGKCSYHANANKAKAPKEQPPSAQNVPPPMMDMRQITAPQAPYSNMAPMASSGVPKDVRESMDQHASIRSSYPPVSGYPPRVDMERYSTKGYDQPLPMGSATASNQYLPMHGDQRGYEPMGMQPTAPRGHYMDSSLPSVSQGYSAPHKQVSSMAGMDRSASPYEPVRQSHQMQHPGYSQHSAHWSAKDPVAAQGRSSMDFYDLKDQGGHQAYQASQYHHHMSVDSSAYSSQRESYYSQQQPAPHHAGSGDGASMYGSYNYQPHQMHNMNLL